jgi:hypothetical protein
MQTVPRLGRLLDLAGSVLFLGGAAVTGRAWVGFRGLPDALPSPGTPAMSAVAVADGFWRLQKIGTALMITGVAVFVLAWWLARRAQGTAPVE